jgi:hypothetical protein
MNEQDNNTMDEQTKQTITNFAENVRAMVDKISNDNNYLEYHLTMYNIYMYKLIDKVLNNKDLSKEVALSIMNNCWEHILYPIKLQQKEEIITLFAARYADIKQSLAANDQEGSNQILDIIFLIGTASELQDNAHLSAVDSFLLILLLVEKLYPEITFEDYKNSFIPFIEAKN